MRRSKNKRKLISTDSMKKIKELFGTNYQPMSILELDCRINLIKSNAIEILRFDYRIESNRNRIQKFRENSIVFD